MASPPRSPGTVEFEEWVAYCFGQGPRDYAREDLDPRKPDKAWEARITGHQIDGATAARYLKRLFLESGERLSAVSDADLAEGVWYVFGSGGGFFDAMTSDWMRRDGTRNPIATADEIAAVFDTMPVIYRDVFEHRCALGFKPESASTSDTDRVSGAVYMIWDMDQCIYLVSGSQPDTLDNPITTAGLAALSTVLRECVSPACLYSALHGLGHLIPKGRYQSQGAAGDGRNLLTRSQAIIDDFLECRAATLTPDLIGYAKCARDGGVQ